MAVTRTEFATVPFNHPILVEASITGAEDAVLSVQYINLGSPAEGGWLAQGQKQFSRFMLFDEPDLHELVFIATRADEEGKAALRVRLTDTTDGSAEFPEPGESADTPFHGRHAALDLKLINF
jgi:hypothetical protein